MLLTQPGLRSQLGGLFILKAVILAVTLAGCIICCRFFCKVMCPLGAIYGLLNKVSLFRVRVDHQTCISCGKCRKICPMDTDPAARPDSAECIRCGKCREACPAKAISISIK